MFDDDARSVTVDITKPRVYAKATNDTSKKKCCKRVLRKVAKNPSDVSIRKYSFPTDKPGGRNVLKNEAILLAYKLYSEQQSKDKRRQRLAINIHEKYKIISTDLRMRLHVSSSEEDVRGVTIDEERRYVHDHSWVNNNHMYKTLKFLFNKQLRLRKVIGYRKDLILNIDCNIKKEQEMYDDSYKKYKEQVKYFDDFIASDYLKSKTFITKWDELADEKYEKLVQLQNLALEKFLTASKILGLDYKYRLQLNYGRFLYYLSLPSWRSQHREFARSVEIEAKGFDFGTTNDEDSFNVIFEILQKELCTGIIKPPLYFTGASDLMQIFERIEQQELNHFIHVSQMEPQARNLRNAVNYLRDLVAQDTAAISNTIKVFEAKLQFCEENCALLETKFYKVVNGMFYDSVGAPDVLKLNLHLQYVYKNVFKDNPTNMNMINIARDLERMYIEYNNLLDEIHSDKVQQAVVQYINVGQERWRKAKAAARELRQFEILQQALLRAHAPASNNRNVLKTKSSPRKTKKKNVKKIQTSKKIQNELTEAEIEYLTMFTDWAEHEDPAKYLHRPSVTDDNKEFD